ncbi:MAG: glycosyltransferase [Saprospiraceae bacterium]|nr:glycosyltransferase [Saprospiraceae bacterium]
MKYITKLRRYIKGNASRWLIRLSGYFRTNYYLRTYPDVKEQGLDPITHFLLYGKSESRNPSEKFNTVFYLSLYPDVRDSELNPLVHYLLFGWRERRCPHPSKYRPNTGEISVMPKKLVKEYAKLIDKSSYFDAQYYRDKYADVARAKYNPLEHYIRFGWKENRNPSARFNTSYYLLQNPDVKKSGIIPLVHYLTIGKEEGRLPTLFLFRESDCISRADITEITSSPVTSELLKVAVVAHLYYPDLVDEIMTYLRHIPVPFHVFCSTSAENKEIIQQKLSAQFSSGTFTLHISAPEERDIGPLIHFLQKELDAFDLVCKIHTKKSPHDQNLANWRTYLLQQLLGSRETVETIFSHFSIDAGLGMIWPVNHPYLYAIGLGDTWGSKYSSAHHKALIKDQFPNLDVYTRQELIEFPAGSMFWFRPEILAEMKPVILDEPDLQKNQLAVDGTILHALERCFGLLATVNQYTFKTIYIPQSDKNVHIEKPVCFTSEAPKILFITHDFCQLGAQGILFQVMNWLHQHTYYQMHLIALEMGNDGGLMWHSFNNICDITLWDELSKGKSINESGEVIFQKIGKVEAIYGNTILTAAIYESLQIFQAPIISHIHELQSSIESFVPTKTVEAYKKYTNHSIACSKEVSQNLIENLSQSESDVSIVEEFIDISSSFKQQQALPGQVADAADIFTVYGCGTISLRKGTDLFILTASELVKRGHTRFQFFWIGQLLWESNETRVHSWSYWETYMKENQLERYLHFTGIQKNPRDFFLQGDVFFLPSREDPFPLVCLEAADCGLPILCFEGAGGIPGFVGDDAGLVVPMDPEKAADAIELYFQNRQLLKIHGENAYEKVRTHHNSDVSIPHILSTLRTTASLRPVVSVIVPIYNHGPYLEKRLDSIYSQTFRDMEVIMLDDASTDGGERILHQYKHRASTQLIVNEKNTGNPFAQWEAGIQRAKGDFIWIAEGDDCADEAFLATLLPFFQGPDMGFVYCASHTISPMDDVTENYYLYAGHYDHLGYPTERWQADYINPGNDEIQYALAVRNTIPNASAVLFRTSALKTVDFTEAKRLKFCGDWHIYVSLLHQAWNIGYCAQPLNYHRKHSNSVVAKTTASARVTLQEYYAMHAYILSITSVSESVFEQMIHSVVHDLAGLWADLSREDLTSFYSVEHLRKLHDEVK